MIEVILAISVVVLVSLVVYLKWRFTFWSKRKVFTFPPRLPFGNANDIMFGKTSVSVGVFRLYKEAKSKGLRYAGFYLFHQPLCLIVDMDLTRDIFVKNFQHFTDRGNYVNEEVDPLTGHLVGLEGAKWRALRAKLTPTFSSAKMKFMFQTLVDSTKDLPTVLDEAIEKKKPIDIKEIFARYTTDVIGSCAFGIDCNCLKDPNTEFRKYGKKIFENHGIRRLKGILSFLIPGFFRVFKIPITDKNVERFFINLVQESISFRDRTKTERKDFMQIMMELRHKELKVETVLEEDGAPKLSYYQNGLSINEIAAQAYIFFAAGFETSSTTLTFLMYELALHPEIQERLREDIFEVLSKHDGKITYEAVNEMFYLDKCIYETLRKYPPLPFLGRICTKTYHVPNSDLVFERGMRVVFSIYGIHHDPEYYPDPEKFDPERFNEENKNKRPPTTFLAFGEGPRICIGLRFGLLQVKVGIIAMLKHFKFTLNPTMKHRFEFKPGPVLTVKDEILIDAERLQ